MEQVCFEAVLDEKQMQKVASLAEDTSNEILASRSSANWYDGNALMIYRAAEKAGPQKIDEIWSELYTRQASGSSDMITLKDFLDACGLKKGEVERE